jgi:hypothetical protein
MDKRVTGEWIDGGYRHLFVLFLLFGLKPKREKGSKRILDSTVPSALGLKYSESGTLAIFLQKA